MRTIVKNPSILDSPERRARHEELRESIVRFTQTPESAQQRVPLGIPELDHALGGGLSRRGVHELIGVGDRAGLRLPPMGVLIHLAWKALEREAADRARGAVWIGRACHPPAWALMRGLRGVVNGRRPQPDRSLLERSIFINAGTPQERSWAIEQAARCSGVFLVVGDGAGFDAALSRRVQLAAQERSVVLLARLDRERSALSVAMTRWLVMPESSDGAGIHGRVAAIIGGDPTPDASMRGASPPGSSMHGASPRAPAREAVPPLEWPPSPSWRMILLRSKQSHSLSDESASIGTDTKRGQ